MPPTDKRAATGSQDLIALLAFYLFATVMIASAVLVIFARNIAIDSPYR